MKPLVSVIVPCHNRIHLLRDCLGSISTQTYSPIELIVVDDCSQEDITGAVASTKWSSAFKISVMRSDENIGPGAAREMGRRNAQGEYICYLDSDDWWYPQKIEKQLIALRNNRNIGMCYCTAGLFSHLPITGAERIRSLSDRSYSSFLPLLLITGSRPWGTGSCMWRRSVADAIGPWLSSWTWEDMDYDCRAGCLDVRLFHLPLTLCYYRASLDRERLSNRDQMFKALHKADALQNIGRSLSASGKLNDRLISTAYGNTLCSHALQLLKLNDRDRAELLLNMAQSLAHASDKLRLQCSVLSTMLSCLHSDFLAFGLGRMFMRTLDIRGANLRHLEQ